MRSQADKIKISAMTLSVVFGFLLMTVKFFAYFITHSNAILTDALESIINVTAGGFALFSVYFSAQPKDKDHPYGHGKIEFLSAGIEGGLILVAGLLIIAKSIYNFFFPNELYSLDTGTILAGAAGFLNFIMGSFLVRTGRKHNSMILIADGKHLISDTVSSIGLILGLLLIIFTKQLWLDNVLAITFGAIIISTGFKLMKQSADNLLDKADEKKLSAVIGILEKGRTNKWIDIHNLRVQQYGAHLHIDCHLTLPWYYSLENTHREVKSLEKLVKENITGDVEFFIHADPCLPPLSCEICMLNECEERKADFVKKIPWSMDTLLGYGKHKIVM
jgi:cation diffusion facilitator family transporter